MIYAAQSRYRENTLGLLPIPQVQASNLTVLSSTTTTSTFQWNDGDGSSRIVLMKQDVPVSSVPVNGTSYTASLTFGSGTQIGSGNYVVSIGSGPIVVTGLTPATTYYIAVFEFNGAGIQSHYFQVNPATGFTPTNQVIQNFGASSALRVLGDSYMVGQGASGSTHYLPNVIAATLGGPTVNNNALGGRGSLRMCQIANQDSTISNNFTETLLTLIGLNDQRRTGGGVKTRNKILMTHLSMGFNQFKKSTTAGGAAGVTRSGSHAGYAANTAGGKYTSAANGATSTLTSGGTWSYTFSGETTVAVQMIGTDGVSNTYGQVQVKIDGVVQNILNSDETTKTTADMNSWYDGITGADPDISPILGPVIYIFTGLTTASHTILITTLNTNRVVVDFFGHMNAPASCKPLVMGLQTYLPAAGYAIVPNLGSTAGADLCNNKVKQAVSFFASRLYPAVWVDSNSVTNTTTDMDADTIHKNDTGYANMATAYTALLIP